jgi:hypothetical protein
LSTGGSNCSSFLGKFFRDPIQPVVIIKVSYSGGIDTCSGVKWVLLRDLRLRNRGRTEVRRSNYLPWEDEEDRQIVKFI